MKHTLYILLILWLLPSLLLGQENVKPNKYNANFELGEQYYKRYAYRIAIKHFKNAYEEDTISSAIKLRLAQCYYKMRDLKDAEYWAKKLVSGGYVLNSNQMYFFVEILASNQQYDEASYWFSQYLNESVMNNSRISRMKQFMSAPDFTKEGANYQVNRAAFNSGYRDFSPTYYQNGVVFVSSRVNGPNIKRWFKSDEINYLNLYYSEPIDSVTYTKPEKFNGLKTRYHEGPLAFYDNDTKVIFTRSNIQERSLLGKKAGQSAEGTTVLKLFMADIVNGDIVNEREFPYNSDEFSTGHPTVSEDGKTLVFVANRPDGYGGSDLYLSHRVADSWTPPVNLGPEINTSEQELFPYLNDNILYFASDGRPGIGGLDVYHTTLIKDKPTEITSFTYPINSPADDFGFATQGDQRGYISSNREDPLNDDIYIWVDVKPEPEFCAEVSVYDSKTNMTLPEPDVEMIDTISGDYLVAIEIMNDSVFKYVIEPARTYKAIVSHSGYFTSNAHFSTEGLEKACVNWRIPFKKLRKEHRLSWRRFITTLIKLPYAIPHWCSLIMSLNGWRIIHLSILK